MRVLLWHVHGSWTTSMVAGTHEYLLPVDAARSPDGRGRARTWDWPVGAVEVDLAELAPGGGRGPDVVVLQRPHEAGLLRAATGLVAGVDVPALYLEHNAPPGHAASSVHPMPAAQRAAGAPVLPLVHVTGFNAVMWDADGAATSVLEHGVIDPGHRWGGERASLAVVVNEPVRRWRVAGTDLVATVSGPTAAGGHGVPTEVYGMGMDALVGALPHLAGRVHEDWPQHRLHQRLAQHRAYLHPYRWTSLGLALVEAMTMGVPVLALSTTAAPGSVPPGAGVLSNDPAVLAATAHAWLADPAAAAEVGAAGREHALARFGIGRFLADVDALLDEARAGAGTARAGGRR